MCTGKKLMDGFGFDKDSVPPMRVAFKACYEKLRPIMPADCPPALADLIRACWEDAPEMRYLRYTFAALYLKGSLTASPPPPHTLLFVTAYRPSFQQILEKLSDLG
jgi:hypothetical protein